MRFALHDILSHRKGGIYQVIGTPDIYRLEATREPAYAYREMPDGVVWVRAQSEMEDGRFERIARPARAMR